jgi:hypothetical protein
MIDLILKIFFYGVKRMQMWESFYANFKFPDIIGYILNVRRKTVEDLNLKFSKVSVMSGMTMSQLTFFYAVFSFLVVL